MPINKYLLIALILCFFTFFNFLFATDFSWDTKEGMMHNQAIHLNIFHDIGRAFTANSDVGYYRPFGFLYSATIFTFFGPTVFIYHFLALSIYLINVWLLFLFLKIFFRKHLAFFLSLIFLVHPMNIESLQYMDLLYTYVLVALLLSSKIHKKRMYILISILLLFAMGTKETGILFIPVIVAFHYFFKKSHLFHAIFASATAVFLFFFIRVINHISLPQTRPAIPIMRLSFFGRVSNIPEIVMYYGKTFFFPKTLAIDQLWTIPAIDATHVFLPFFIIFSVIGALILFGLKLYGRDKKRCTVFLFFSLWFLAGMSLNLQLFPLDMTVADRWFYFPMIGVLGMIGLALESFSLQGKNGKIVYILAFCILFCLSIRTIIRNNDWDNNLSLYTHDIVVNDNYDLENNLGIVYYQMGNTQKAKQHILRSTLLGPYRWTSWRNLAALYEQEGRYEAARKDYAISIHNNLFYEEGYSAYAHFLVFHDIDHAEVFINQSLRKFPQNADLYTLRAVAEIKLGKKEAALSDAQRAYQINPTGEISYFYSHLSNNLPLEIK